MRILRAFGLVSVQGPPVHGRMHQAVPPGGALVPELLAAANHAVRNPLSAHGLEVLGRVVLHTEVDLEVATDTLGAFALRAGQECTVESSVNRAAYLAVRGGVSSPATLLCAGGRPFRAGDEVPVGGLAPVPRPAAPTPPPWHARPPWAEPRPIRLSFGPDHGAFPDLARSRLLTSTYRVSAVSDRTGTRLLGPALPTRGGSGPSRPMVCGALEVPPDGVPIVLGPEHPTTGGYPLLAVIVSEDRGRFFAAPLGTEVRWSSVD